jgi:hypothetical protein
MDLKQSWVRSSGSVEPRIIPAVFLLSRPTRYDGFGLVECGLRAACRVEGDGAGDEAGY